MKTSPPKSRVADPFLWTPQQVDAILQFICLLKEAIWSIYDQMLILKTQKHNPQDDIDDDMPF